MARVRLLLLIPMIIVELLLLIVCWVAALVKPVAAEKMSSFCTRVLPDLDWYFGANK